MQPKPHIVEESNIRLAGEVTGMCAKFLGKVEITVGGYRFVHPIYVGPLQDKMLFGIDFLKSHGAQISCETGALRVKGVPGMIEMSSGVDWLVLNAVSCRRAQIPLHTAQVIECDLANEMSDFIIEPANVFPLGIVASRTYNNSGNKGKLCVINMTDRGHFVKTGSVVGIVTAACAVKNSEASVRRVSTEGQKDCEHVSSLIRDLKETL